ncbi:CHAT domain-containing protein [Scytonema hofmannii FACHB-248]|uniref:CHAT domain-containing protein n=1 Tax=Scytonema hofmannii FACHB-248 TaxID=1842502 RepID=A0ABR8GQ12_9CYAN|nr:MULTISPECIES: CHAT domain-containing protein [Nostocales]MBD2605154.1 CHAT domain-containing protein [Scytonema hofmannii FACHB-248]
MNDSQIKILFLTADPSDESRLRLGQELRDIKARLRKEPGKFQIEQHESVRVGDITDAIFELEPQIVHFSGHGKSTGELCFENEVGKVQPVKPDALAAMFKLFAQSINCVVMNACYSEIQAEAIAEHIPFVIGMNDAIGDKAAIAFAVGFYKALAANRSIEDAYEFGCVEIRLQGIPEHLKPVIYYKKNISVQEVMPKPTNLTPGQRRRILQELESLQEQYNLLSEKLKHLRIDLAIQAGASVKFQLEKEKERTENQIKQLSQQIEELENKLQ